MKDYITTGSFALWLLLTGVVVGTGTNNAASPNVKAYYKTEQIKEAILIGFYIIRVG